MADRRVGKKVDPTIEKTAFLREPQLVDNLALHLAAQKAGVWVVQMDLQMAAQTDPHLVVQKGQQKADQMALQWGELLDFQMVDR